MLTGDGIFSRSRVSTDIFGYGGDLSLNRNMDNGSTSLEAKLVTPDADIWSIGGLGMRVYGSFSAAASFLENIKESYENFIYQIGYNWSHPYEK